MAGDHDWLGGDTTRWTSCSALESGQDFLVKRSKYTAKMVIGLLAITAIPTVTGVGNAISAQKKQNASLSKEQEKFHMTFIMEHEGKMQELGTGVVKDQKVS